MNKFVNALIAFTFALTLTNCHRGSETKPFHSYWDILPDRYWTGPEYWANRLQDWRLKNGKLECINADLPKRTLHLLSRQLSGRPGSLDMQVTTGLIQKSSGLPEQVYSGFLIGAGSEAMDFRRRSLIHGASGKGGGMIAAISDAGRILLIDNETGELIRAQEPPAVPGSPLPEAFLFSLELNPRGDRYNMIIRAADPETREEIVRLDTLISRQGNFSGNLALICNGGSFWFEDWQVKGFKIRVAEDHELGPVIGTLYSLNEGTLKLTAQLAPLSESNEQTAEFQVRDAGSGKWNTMASSQLVLPGYLACFKLTNWRDEIRHDYRIVYTLRMQRE